MFGLWECIEMFWIGSMVWRIEKPQTLNFRVYVICFENNEFMLIVDELRWNYMIMHLISEIKGQSYKY
jgi:hypothetical protein